MNILVLDKFYKSVPKDKEQKVTTKVQSLVKQLEDSKYDFERLPKGNSLRKLENVHPHIYKFKFNEGDRILCTIAGKFYDDIRDEYKNSLVLLEYCTHDKQIITAKNRDFSKQGIRSLKDNASKSEYPPIVESDQVPLQLEQFSLNKSIPMIISHDELDHLFGEEGYLYYLDSDQQECVINNDQGQLVLGSAGSGKTTIGAYKLASYVREHRGKDFKLVYVTFSRRLKEKVERLFRDITTKLYGMDAKEYEGKIDFFTLEEHLEGLKIDGRQGSLLSYEAFKEWYASQPGMNRVEYDSLSLWKERRGIMQGIIGLNWQYEIRLNDKFFDAGTLGLLREQDYITSSDQQGSFCLKAPLQDICSFLQYRTGNSVSFHETVLQAFKRAISLKRELSEDEYLQLNQTYTMFNNEQRKRVIQLFKKYKTFVQHRNSQGYYEEGDWVRRALALSEPIYDYMVVDEVQDLTEVQIYYLSQLMNKNSQIFVCGDFHQNVNPTFFSAGRIVSIFKFVNGSGHFNHSKTLTNNYRSSRSIVEFANNVSALRNEKIRTKQNLVWTETAIRDYTRKPFLYRGQKDSLFQSVADKSYVMVVVPNEMTKTELVHSYPELESRVLTVSEIKGIERKYIVSYNMMSAFYEEWRAIFTQNVKLNHEVYRYYFNLLYVAVTRARDVFCMIEDHLGENESNWLISQVDVIEQFDLVELGLSESSTLDQLLKEAEEFEYDETYDHAIALYENLLKKDHSDYTILAQQGLKRCKIKKDYDIHRDPIRCGRELMELKEFDEAITYLRKSKEPRLLLQALLSSDRHEHFDIPKEMEKLGTNPLQELVNLNDDALMTKYLDRELKSYLQHLKQIEATSNEMKNIFTNGTKKETS